MKTCPTNKAIASNLDLLHHRLQRATTSALQATATMAAHKRNLAVGYLLDLERLLPECDALYRTILLLHRSWDGEDTL